jgi:hypothetical protein
MKNLYKSVIILVSLLLFWGQEAKAQFTPVGDDFIKHSHFYYPSIDWDIYRIKDNAFPELEYSFDDVLQYIPAGSMIVMKACGYQSRSGWGRMFTSDAFTVASMTAAVNGVKYTVRRMRPDMSARNSFPSGHTATAFMSATMLHMEYGWRSPWISAAGYAMATTTALSRVVNDKHWFSDIVMGALIGIGATHLGYYLADLIFKDKHLTDKYEPREFEYDFSERHYDIYLMATRKFILGDKTGGRLPERGGSLYIGADIPVTGHLGVGLRAGAGSLTYSNVYNGLLGAHYTKGLGKRFDLTGRIMAGAAKISGEKGMRSDALAGVSIGALVSNNCRVRALLEYENLGPQDMVAPINSINLGFSASFCW